MSNQELTREQVLAKAEELGIVHNKRAKTSSILEMINELTGEKYEEKQEEAPKKEGFLRCIIHSNDRDNTETTMEGSVNGEYYRVKLGEVVELPYKYKPSLDNAKIEVKTQEFDADGQPNGKINTRVIPRYIIEAV